MPIKIAFDVNFLTSLLINPDVNFPNEDFPDVYNIKSPNGGPLKYLLNNRCDIALLNIIDYGLAQKDSDVRIIKGPALCLKGNCGIIGLNFKSGVSEIKSIGEKNLPNILHKITSILLSERYNIESKSLEIKNDADVNIINGEATLDLSEDWADSFAQNLPLYFWCSKSEELSIPGEEAVELLNVLCQTNSEFVENNDDNSGEIIRTWNKELEHDTDEALEIFYYHGILPEIYASKFYGDIME
jgi:hypothetical protein